MAPWLLILVYFSTVCWRESESSNAVSRTTFEGMSEIMHAFIIELEVRILIRTYATISQNYMNSLLEINTLFKGSSFLQESYRGMGSLMFWRSDVLISSCFSTRAK